ncbi:sialate O-acetylesterase, partial [Bacteroides thetaiotaomicron]
MKSSGIKTSTVLASFLLAACLSMRAEVKLPAIFSDGMVMQQQTNANLWGTATPNKKVTVTTGWNGKQYAVTADKNGSWKLSVSTPEAGGPYTITFDDGTQKTLNNILIGELWLCSGQSNMEMPMKGFKNQPVENANMDILRSKNS